MNPDLYIIGNGVIARALAVILSHKGREVTLIRGSVDHEPRRRERIRVETGAEALEAQVTVSTLSHHPALDGLVLLATKAFGNAGLAAALKGRTGDSPIVFLQNGLHIENGFLEQGYPALYRCVLMATSQSAGPEAVTFRAVAASPVGIIRGAEPQLARIVAALHTETFPFRAEPDIQPVIWKKVISNCVFNSICPLLEADNGIFHRHEGALGLAGAVIGEGVRVARENGIALSEEEVLENVLSISRSADGQLISTYQDILHHRPTEIEALNLAVAKAAITTPVPVTAFLGQMIRTKAELKRL